MESWSKASLCLFVEWKSTEDALARDEQGEWAGMDLPSPQSQVWTTLSLLLGLRAVQGSRGVNSWSGLTLRFHFLSNDLRLWAVAVFGNQTANLHPIDDSSGASQHHDIRKNHTCATFLAQYINSDCQQSRGRKVLLPKHVLCTISRYSSRLGEAEPTRAKLSYVSPEWQPCTFSTTVRLWLINNGPVRTLSRKRSETWSTDL